MFSKLLFYSKICTKRNALLFSNKKYISDTIVNYKINTNNDNNYNTKNVRKDTDNNDDNNITKNSKNIKIKIKLKLKNKILNENNPYNDRED